MATKYPENIATTHYVDVKLDALNAEYLQWSTLPVQQWSGSKVSSKNQLKLAEIRLNFAKGNDLFYKKKFQDALTTYRNVQALVFQLLYPSFKPHSVFDAPGDIPVKAALFEPLLKIGTEMAFSQAAYNDQSVVSYVQLESLPADVREYAQAFDQTGILNVTDSTLSKVNEKNLVALEFAKNKDWDQAENFFKSGLNLLANPSSREAKIAKASLQLNLAAVYAQKGNLELARKFATESGRAFKENNDTLGEAQAKLNLAAAFNKVGNDADAAAISKEATELLKRADHASLATDHDPGITAVPHGSAVGSITATAVSAPTSVLTSTNGHAATITSLSNTLETSTKATPIFDLASKKGAGVLFRLPIKGDGWMTQDLEGNIEKDQKIPFKQLGIKLNDQLVKVNWSQANGTQLSDIKTGYYDKRKLMTKVTDVNVKYSDVVDIGVNLSHMYLYQLPVCLGDCYHFLGEFDKALEQYLAASTYEFINTAIEVPALWIKIARNYLGWGNAFYKNDDLTGAATKYVNVITADDNVPVDSPLYKNSLNTYGTQVATLISNIADPIASTLNPDTITVVLDIRTKLQMIGAGLDYFGFPPNYFPIFKFDYLQSVASYFAQQAIQAEREYINFIAHGEDEQMTRQQLEQSVDIGKAQVDLTQKQVEHAQAELQVNRDNAQLAQLRVQNAQAHRQEYADVSYEITALDAATVFASGPEGYDVSYTYYSPSEGKDVTISGNAAYKVMEQAAWKKGMLSRQMELSNIDRGITELNQNKQMALDQVKVAQVAVEIAQQQKVIAEMNKKHAQELLDSFESQIFTPEVWFQLGNRILDISKTYLQRAIRIARQMQKAYELETGRALNAIKFDYTTNIISGLLSADYLLVDINYFSVDRIDNSRSKDIPVKQIFSLAELNPIGFQTTFKTTGKLEFETSLSDFERRYPGAYLRKIKKVEIVVEGLMPPGGVHGTLKSAGISRDRNQNGDVFFRIQPAETLYLSNYNPRADLIIFQPDQRVLDIFEMCGVATGWTLEIPVHSNDMDYRTIADVKMIVYYTSQFDPILENNIRLSLPTTGEKSTALPFRIVFPDEYFKFIDTGELKFKLTSGDFAYNETNHVVKNISLKIVTDEVAVDNLTFSISEETVTATAVTNNEGIVKSDEADNTNPLNSFIGKQLTQGWTIGLSDADNSGFNRNKIKDLFFFVEYSFSFKGM